MDDRQRRALQRTHSKLVKDIRVEPIREHLFTKGILNEDLLEIITSKVRHCLSTMLQSTRGIGGLPFCIVVSVDC